MKQHTPWRLLAIAAATALMLTACGSSDDNSSPGGGSGSGSGGSGSTGGSGSGSGGSGGSSGSGSTGNSLACASVGNYTATQIPTADEQDCIVGLHNDARAEVGVSPLTWSDTVANVALTYAQKLESQGCPMTHSSRDERKGYGENLASLSSVSSGTQAWINEKSLYKYPTPIPTNPQTDTSWQAWGHYTQIIWNSTTEVGCAYAKCSSRGVFICNYNPAGNYQGRAPY